MISAISFDIWNTLLDIDVVFRRLAKAISIAKGLDPVEIEKLIQKVYKKTKELRLYITNSSEVRSFPMRSRNLLANALGIDVHELGLLIEATLNSIEANSIVYEDVKPTLELLRSLNLKMGIIGNTVFWESIYTRELLERLELRNYFRTQIYSDEIGVFKPGKEIFLEFCRRLNVKPQEVIHVGDSVVEDVGGAISSNMKVVLIDRLGLTKKISIPTIGLYVAQSLSDILEAIQILM